MSAESRRRKKPKRANKKKLYIYRGNQDIYFGYTFKYKVWLRYFSQWRRWEKGEEPILYKSLSKLKSDWECISRLPLLIRYGIHWDAELRKFEYIGDLISKWYERRMALGILRAYDDRISFEYYVNEDMLREKLWWHESNSDSNICVIDETLTWDIAPGPCGECAKLKGGYV